MMPLNKTCLLLIFIFYSISAVSQEYDFEIPEPDPKGIQFNGNLDTKWGLLHTRKGSPFYGIQFFDDTEKNDYLSQYRLDYYLDGSYNFKQVGFFMKAYTQYSKEEPLSLSFYELFGSLNFSPRLSMSIGKRRFNWGKGYAFNPAGFVNAEKDPENPDLALAGKASVYLNYNKSFTSDLLRNFAATAVFLPPESVVNQRFAPAGQTGAALKLYFLLKNIDIDLMALLDKDEPSRIGIDFSTNLKENLEVHAEYSYANDEIFYISNSEILNYNSRGGSLLLGLRYLHRTNTTFILEYYHNNKGLSKNEFTDYLGFLHYSLNSDDPAVISQARLAVPVVSNSKTMMRDYLYLKISQPEPFDLVYSSISLFTIYNLADNSFLLSPQISYKPYTNFELLLWPFFMIGNEDSEYGTKQFRKKAEIWLRFYF
jgi:hypothetical protein